MLLACDLPAFAQAAGEAGGMESSGPVAAGEAEQVMKVQELILRAMAGNLKWWQAADAPVPRLRNGRAA